MTHHQCGISALVPQQGSTQDSSLEWVHHLGMCDKEYEYEEEGFCLGNIILEFLHLLLSREGSMILLRSGCTT